ncbi:flavodoxin [Paratractidigestivibacter sp.]|uniref:flavodoxin n=1 Tax=Paratractidigestivibacter sp. TaxID=2847316 RepID=UPI002ACB0AE6|nr:flavodoxin [Paratractidigestivibacter sp.]
MTNFTRRDVLKMAGIISAGLALDGCSAGGSNGGSSTGESSASSAGTTSGSSDSTSSTAGSSVSGISAGSKVLVAYYSAQGHTKRVAEAAAAELGADLFEIVPAEVYTDDDLNWTNDQSRVTREYEDESLRDVPLAQTTPDNWADYDTVLLGYPIWWAIAAWPTNHFASDNDFAGKKVIPFCTSASSGLGQSGQLLADAAGTGDWQSGQRFSSGASDDEVRSWAKSI